MHELTIYIKKKLLQEIVLTDIYMSDIIETKLDDVVMFDCLDAKINIYSGADGNIKHTKPLDKDIFFENYYEQIETQILDELGLYL